ncbi:MAG: ABC transporter ATP-binding protein [Corynebacterium sp.]|uniref:ABC transporter ATP-binding protein n=1 Tax=Corynebacterium sp. TaxID=1720 RepID=UPI0026E04F75|nr:ABC transporter ATP-binding protein [Corynebacterium sp.]MDO5668379.1 ABC transporter ATP-binding protein [Corynebacterium sp.]
MTSAPRPPALSVRGLCAAFPGPGRTRNPVLHDVDLEVPEGELLAVLGPSGCGKTTLLRVLAGLLPATAGSVDLAGRRVVDGPHSVAPERRGVGLVPQEASLFPHLDVAENVAFGISRSRPRLRRAPVPERVSELLELVGIPELARRMPSELSGGQAQRVALARALAPEPDLVLLDEPFSALDASLRLHLRTEVRAVLAARGATGLLVTHDQDEALSVADRVALLKEGRLIQVGTPVEVYSLPSTAWVAEFVGSCALLNGTLQENLVSCALGTVEATRAPGVDTVGKVVVRPEQVRLSPAPGIGVRAAVTAVEYAGHSTLYRVRLASAGEHLVAREQGPARFGVGDEVTVAATSTLHVVP